MSGPRAPRRRFRRGVDTEPYVLPKDAQAKHSARVLLTATTLSLATCLLSQPLEIGSTRRMQRDDVLDATLSPEIVLRLGWPPVGPPLPGHPRRSFADIATVAPDR